MVSNSQHIKNILEIDLALAEEISAICEHVKYPSNTIIQHRGETDSKAIFLLSGICKYSIFDKNGFEVIFEFAQAKNFLPYAFFGFYRKNFARMNFSSVTDIEGLEVQTDTLMPIVDNNPHLYGFFIKAIMQRHQKLQFKEICNIQKTSTERYRKFVEMYNDIITDIPLKDLASYLHIQPGSLSRIRKILNA